MFNTKVNACVCNTPPLTKETLSKYKYIALIKIIKLKPISFKTDAYPNENDEADIEVLENFKGSIVNKILINFVRSSCDMGVRESEVWIVFANEVNGYPMIGACGYNQRFTIKNYSPFWGTDNYYKNSIETFQFLRAAFLSFPLNGTYKAKYLNGKPAYTLQFKNGKLDGEQLMYDYDGNKIISEFYKDSLRNGNTTIWYDGKKIHTKCSYFNNQLNGDYNHWYYNGTKGIESKFLNGKKNDITTRRDENGAINFTGKYKDDYLIDTSISWFTIDTTEFGAKASPYVFDKISVDTIFVWNQTRQIQSLEVHDSVGNLIHRIEYFRNGSLKNEINFEPNSKLYFEHTYHFNGITQYFMVYWVANNSIYRGGNSRYIYQESCFNSDGKRIRKTFFDKEGLKVIKAIELENGKETVVFDITKKK